MKKGLRRGCKWLLGTIARVPLWDLMKKGLRLLDWKLLHTLFIVPLWDLMKKGLRQNFHNFQEPYSLLRSTLRPDEEGIETDYSTSCRGFVAFVPLWDLMKKGLRRPYSARLYVHPFWVPLWDLMKKGLRRLWHPICYHGFASLLMFHSETWWRRDWDWVHYI